jgi:hypothetical protein
VRQDLPTWWLNEVWCRFDSDMTALSLVEFWTWVECVLYTRHENADYPYLRSLPSPGKGERIFDCALRICSLASACPDGAAPVCLRN